MVKGGKAIAAGGYGCVFNPALKCKNKERIKGVSKLLKKIEAQKEFNETKVIRPIMKKIKNYQDYVIFPTDICEADGLEEEDLNDFDKKCSKFSDAKRNLGNYKILNMPFGGPDLSDYFKKNIIDSNFVTINNSLIKLIKNAVVVFNNKKLIHADLKAQNILVTPDDLKCKIIDWGLAMKYSSTEDIDEEMEWRPIQFNIPCSNILFSSFYRDILYRVLSSEISDDDFNDDHDQFDVIYNAISDNFDEYTSQYGNGHTSYLLYIFEIIMNNLNMKNKTPREVMFTYMANCVQKFTEIQLLRYRQTFQFNPYHYFQKVYMYNCDIWGVLTAYFVLLTLSRKQFKFASDDSNTIVKFRTELSQILWSFMIEHDSTKINVEKLTKQLKELNFFFNTPTNIGNSTSNVTKSLKSTLSTRKELNQPSMTTSKPPESTLSERKTRLRELSKKLSSKKYITAQTSLKSKTKRKPRCPNGTRRNKKTGNCESIAKYGQTFQVNPYHYFQKVPPKVPTKKSRMKRCPNGTRRNKRTGLCE